MKKQAVRDWLNSPAPNHSRKKTLMIQVALVITQAVAEHVRNSQVEKRLQVLEKSMVAQHVERTSYSRPTSRPSNRRN